MSGHLWTWFNVDRVLPLEGFVESQSTDFPHCPSMSLLYTIFKQKTGFKHVIGRIYELLNLHNQTTLNDMRNLWEEDLEMNKSQKKSGYFGIIPSMCHCSLINIKGKVLAFCWPYNWYFSKGKRTFLPGSHLLSLDQRGYVVSQVWRG